MKIRIKKKDYKDKLEKNPKKLDIGRISEIKNMLKTQGNNKRIADTIKIIDLAQRKNIKSIIGYYENIKTEATEKDRMKTVLSEYKIPKHVVFKENLIKSKNNIVVMPKSTLEDKLEKLNANIYRSEGQKSVSFLKDRDFKFNSLLEFFQKIELYRP